MYRIIFTAALVTGLALGSDAIAQGGGGSGSSGSTGSTGTAGSNSSPGGTLTQPNAVPPAGVPGGTPRGTVGPEAGNPTGRTDPALGTTRPPDGQRDAPATDSTTGQQPSGKAAADETRPSGSGPTGTTGTSLPRRQPRATDIPAEAQERQLQRSREDQELDRKLRICRGC